MAGLDASMMAQCHQRLSAGMGPMHMEAMPRGDGWMLRIADDAIAEMDGDGQTWQAGVMERTLVVVWMV